MPAHNRQDAHTNSSTHLYHEPLLEHPPQTLLTHQLTHSFSKHARAPSYAVQKLLSDPTHLSDVVRFDLPLLGDLTDLRVVHLQCHIGTDTLSLARCGARSVVGLDFSGASLAEARDLAAKAAGGEKVSYVQAEVYDAVSALREHGGEAGFDLVFTGIGALCWLPSVRRWAETVAALLRPGGRLFIREGHPVLWSIDEFAPGDRHVIGYPYFEQEKPMVWEDNSTYVETAVPGTTFTATTGVEWNHGLGEIVQALLDAGMLVTGLVEHQSVPWPALPGKLVEREDGEWELKEGKERLPLTYTLQAVKKG